MLHCAPPPHAPAGLPAPVVLETRCGRFTVTPGGAVTGPARISPRPKGCLAVYPLGDGFRLTCRQGRLALVRGSLVVWRSRGRFRTGAGPLTVDGAARRGRLLAFSTYRGSLYVARVGVSRERPVARAEEPVGWTRRGELVTRRRGPPPQEAEGALLLRSADGALVRRIAAARPAARFVFDASTGTLLRARRGTLLRSDGRREVFVARGLHANTVVEPLGRGLVALLDASRVTVLGGDGRVLASTGVRQWLDGGVVARADGRAFAFAVGGAVPGAATALEHVFVLAVGARRAREVLRYRVRGPFGERSGAQLSWHGRWLLYSGWQGQVVALDTATRRRVDLSRLVRRLPGAPDPGLVSFYARWR